MHDLATAELFVLALVSFLVPSCALFALAAPAVLGRVAGWAPVQRHRAVWLLCAAPLSMTFALFAASVMPALESLLFSAVDHCLAHDDGHAHLCFIHRTHHAPHAWFWVLTAMASTWLLWHVCAAVARAVHSMRIVRSLVLTGDNPRGRTVVLEHSSALCITAGLLRPRVLVSRGLLEALSPDQQRALLAHEQGHTERRDALMRFTAAILSRVYPRQLRRRMLDELELAAEQACDEAAASAVRDRLVVADTILAVERATSDIPGDLRPLAVAMGQLAIETRVRALLDPPEQRGALHLAYAAMVAISIGLALQADPLHHAVESLLSPLLH
jgi:beta-lactamase regulating signal transducer with metallopeptidase domain